MSKFSSQRYCSLLYLLHTVTVHVDLSLLLLHPNFNLFFHMLAVRPSFYASHSFKVTTLCILLADGEQDQEA